VWEGAIVVADYGVWIARLLLCVVFALSAWGKFTDRSGTRTAVAEFGISARYVGVVAWTLPLLEAALAVGLLPGATALWAGLAGLVLLGVFTAMVARLLRLAGAQLARVSGRRAKTRSAVRRSPAMRR
jgi:uncharacterized membrane protein YphA (DoxX/SURF4 family)